jgi:hypothetical protein
LAEGSPIKKTKLTGSELDFYITDKKESLDGNQELET